MPPHPTSHHHLSTGSRGTFLCMRNFNTFIPKMLVWCSCHVPDPAGAPTLLVPLLPPKLFSEPLAQHGCCFCRRSTDRSPGNRVDADMASTSRSSCQGRSHSSTCEVSSMGSAAAPSCWGRSLHPRKAQPPRPRSREMARSRGVSHRAADH